MMSKTGRIRAWLFLLAAVTFFAGGAVFLAGERILDREDARALPGDEWQGELDRTLGLSEEQARILGALLEGQRSKTRNLIEATEAGLEELGRETNRGILEILDASQKAKYQKLCRGD